MIAQRAITLGALQIRPEFAKLCRLVGEQRPDTVLEIGTAEGGSWYAWCELASPTAHLLSIDLPGGPFGGTDIDLGILESYAQPDQRVGLFRGNSHDPDLREAVIDSLDSTVDFLFIDGDHSYDGVKQDFEAYSPLVGPGGLVAFHDIVEHPTMPRVQVARFWQEIREHYQHEEILSGAIWGGIGVLRL